MLLDSYENPEFEPAYAMSMNNNPLLGVEPFPTGFFHRTVFHCKYGLKPQKYCWTIPCDQIPYCIPCWDIPACNVRGDPKQFAALRSGKLGCFIFIIVYCIV